MGVLTYGYLDLSIPPGRLSVRRLRSDADFTGLSKTLQQMAQDRPEGVLIEFFGGSSGFLRVLSPQVWESRPSGLGWRVAAVEGEGISEAASLPGLLQVDFLEANRLPNAWARVDLDEPPKGPEGSKKRASRRFDFLDILVRRDAETRLFNVSVRLRCGQECMNIVARDRGHLDGVEASIGFSESWPRGFPPLVLIGNRSKMMPWLTIAVWPKPMEPEARK